MRVLGTIRYVHRVHACALGIQASQFLSYRLFVPLSLCPSLRSAAFPPPSVRMCFSIFLCVHPCVRRNENKQHLTPGLVYAATQSPVRTPLHPPLHLSVLLYPVRASLHPSVPLSILASILMIENTVADRGSK